MDDDRDFKARIDKAAKNYRLLKRADVFERNRKNQKDELSYLKILPVQEKNLILQSINGQVPPELPPLSPFTISYYRRSSKAIYRTRVYEGGQLNAHMTYESLFILAGIQEIHFSNYQQVIKEFQTDLQKYISSPFPQIREMAMIAAGNKILGREKDIQKIVQMNPKQMWVIINHIYERKISSCHLFKYMKENNEIAFRSLFEMSNSNDNEIIDLIMKQQEVLQDLIQNLTNFNIDIRKYSLRIIGNILAEKEDYVYTLNKFNILDYFYQFLNENDPEIRKDACWALSNFAVEKLPSTALVQNQKTIEKLVFMLQNQKEIKIKVQLCHVFSSLVAFAEKNDVYNVVCYGHLLERCGQFLSVQDQDLIHVSLYLMSKIVELGSYFSDEEGNFFIKQIRSLGIKSKITQKTYYTDNNEISKLSSQLEQLIDEEDY